MSGDFNGKKAKEFYFNSKKIVEAYFNGDKVYSSGIPVWRFINGEIYYYLFGEYSINGLVTFNTSTPTNSTITNISGVLGQPSSYIWTSSGNENTPCSYVSTKIINNIPYYFYFNNAGWFGEGNWVLDNYQIGDKTISNFSNVIISVTSITNDTIVINVNGSSITASKDNNYFGILTKQGVVQQ